jgi:hypothetical protein
MTPNTISQSSATYIPLRDEPDSCVMVAIRPRSRSVRSWSATIIETPWNITNAITPATCRNFHQV